MWAVSNSAGVRTSSIRGAGPESRSSRRVAGSTVAGRAGSEAFMSPRSAGAAEGPGWGRRARQHRRSVGMGSLTARSGAGDDGQPGGGGGGQDRGGDGGAIAGTAVHPDLAVGYLGETAA